VAGGSKESGPARMTAVNEELGRIAIAPTNH